MSSLQFLGVYSGNLPALNQQKLDMPMDRQYWYLWFNQKDQHYIVQAIDKEHNIIDTPYLISSLVFGLNFMEESALNLYHPGLPDLSSIKYYGQDRYNKNIAISAKKIPKTSAVIGDESTPSQKQSTKEATPFPSELIKKTEKKESLGADNLAGVLLQLKEDKDKDAQLQNITALTHDKECKTVFASAIVLWRKGNKRAASVKFRKILSENISFVEAHKHTLADCAMQLRKIQQTELALAFALRCTTLSPTDSHTYFNVGRIYYDQKNYKASLLYLEKALTLEPDLAPALKLREVGMETLTLSTTKTWKV